MFPYVPSGNLNGPTTMVAEKGADMIKEDYNISTVKRCTIKTENLGLAKTILTSESNEKLPQFIITTSLPIFLISLSLISII